MTFPMILEVIRINDTAIRVTWEPLTLIEARGFIKNYTITLQPQGSRKRTGSIVKTVPSNVSNAIITGLDPKLAYLISVSVSTIKGIATSENTILTAFGMNQIVYCFV